jgi:hypothetical protein
VWLDEPTDQNEHLVEDLDLGPSLARLVHGLLDGARDRAGYYVFPPLDRLV